MTDADIARLRALAQAATPGPWRLVVHTGYDPAPDDYDDWTVYGPDDAQVAYEPNGKTTNARHNAPYIAAASPDVLLALLDERDAVLAANRDCLLHFAALKADYDAAVADKTLATQTSQRLAEERDALRALLREASATHTRAVTFSGAQHTGIEIRCGICGAVEPEHDAKCIVTRIDAALGGEPT